MVTRISQDMISPGAVPALMDAANSIFEVGDFTWSARSAKTGWLLCQGQAVSRTTYAALYSEIGIQFGSGDGSTTFNLPDGRSRGLIGAGQGVTTEALAPSAFNTSNDRITVAENIDRWIAGTKVRFTTTGVLPGGISAGVDYYLNRLSATEVRLSTTLLDSLLGNIVDITSQGSGVHTMTQTLTNRAVGEKGGEETHALSIAEMPAHTHPVYGATSDGSGGSQVSVPSSGTPYAANNKTASTGGTGAHNNMHPFLAANLFIYVGV